ncbi:succinate dehydrogenase/fumarate reductase iron-sulfur subunit [candidate division KSB1 bacterium]
MDKYNIKIQRFDPDKDKKPYFQTFEVPFEKGMTVLDALYYIQNHIDGSIAFRSSCRAGICGSCAMSINGKYRLACETQVAFFKKTVTLKPLNHLPVIRDLFVDQTPFWKAYEYIKPYLMAGNPDPEKERAQNFDERKELDLIVDCILCSACYASCPVVDTDPKYLGPAALMKADRFIKDSRDSAYAERLELVGDDHGVFRCHSIYNCQAVCPKQIDPTGSINNLRVHLMKHKLCGKKK